MGKIRIRTGRGTGTIEVDDDPKKWSGDEFRKIQEARKKEAANRMVQIGRAHVELQSHHDLVCRLLLEKKNNIKKKKSTTTTIHRNHIIN